LITKACHGNEIFVNVVKVYDLWVSTPPCGEASEGESTTLCPGVYLYQAGFRAGEQEVVVDLPPANVTLTVQGCSLSPPENFCPEIPDLVLTAEEPLPDETITAVHVIYEGNLINCEGDRCQIPLRSTPDWCYTLSSGRTPFGGRVPLHRSLHCRKRRIWHLP
jgi:hypothetical protein